MKIVQFVVLCAGIFTSLLSFVLHAAETEVNEQRVAALGIRKISGEHLTLYTDLPAAPAIDELPRVFDTAVPLWCESFSIDREQTKDWRIIGCVIQAREKFASCELLPPNLPEFLHGFQRERRIWLHEQPSDYYRRHLVLHEGTHAFMAEFLGGCGPAWYAEGMAELHGTHQWLDGKLKLGYMPRRREEVLEWGRIKIIRDEYVAGRGMMLDQILQIDGRRFLQVTPYGWSWGAATFLKNHPLCRQRFQALQENVADDSSAFSIGFRESLAKEWRHINEDWQLFVSHLDYGYDVARAAVVHRPSQPLPADGATAKIAANRGWQSTGFRLTAGTKYQVTASGRFQIGDQPRIWECEPSGVTIHYHQRRPLGMLLGAVSDDEQPLTEVTPLTSPEPIGTEREITVGRNGVLFLRINESCANLSDNAGEITVRVVPK